MSDTTVKVHCPDCHVVSLPPYRVSVLVVEGHPMLSTYAFRCPICDAQIVRSALPDEVALLQSGGVRTDVLPAEVAHRTAQPALTYDDLLDFALHLGTTDLLASEVAA